MNAKAKVKGHEKLTPVFVIRACTTPQLHRPHWITVGYIYPAKYSREELQFHLILPIQADWEEIRLVPPDVDDVRDAQKTQL